MPRPNPNNYSVDEVSGCWIWQGSKNHFGYGWLRGKSRSRYAHRIKWEEANGPLPDGYHLDHLCRNPSCVNPDHLEMVTPAENTRRGLSAKVKKQHINRILLEFRSGMTLKRLAERYSISASAVSLIVRGDTWKGVGSNALISRDNRSRFGEHNRKISHAQVMEARKLYADGHTISSIARKFGITPQTMGGILKKKGAYGNTSDDSPTTAVGTVGAAI